MHVVGEEGRYSGTMAKVISPPPSPGQLRKGCEDGVAEEVTAFLQKLPRVTIDACLLEAFTKEAEDAVDKCAWDRLEIMFGILAVTDVTAHAELIRSTTQIAVLARELVFAQTSSRLLKHVAAKVYVQIERGIH